MKTKPTLIKKQALLTSEKVRVGKFKRVGQDFLEQVDAEVDAYLRRLFNEIKVSIDPPILPVGKLFTPEAEAKMLTVLNLKIASIVQNRVKAHPSIGQTLKG